MWEHTEMGGNKLPFVVYALIPSTYYYLLQLPLVLLLPLLSLLLYFHGGKSYEHASFSRVDAGVVAGWFLVLMNTAAQSGYLHPKDLRLNKSALVKFCFVCFDVCPYQLSCER